ncbi:peptidylprolyl isomerase [Candidatus Pacearchaeota archaeon]|nr:peptidylprolyl isomerase [Candidatus Pacearchaeota archaeon]
MAIKNGDRVVVKYEGKLEDGEIFDSSEKHGQPLEFEVGKGVVIKGFEDSLIGMEKGQKKEFGISSNDAYGEIMPELIKEIPRESLPEFPEGQEPQTGMVLMMSTPEGQQFPARVKEVKDNAIVFDLNHPLAGKDLKFSIEVMDINPPASEKQDSCACVDEGDCNCNECGC